MPDIRFSHDIDNRYQFGALCQQRGLLGTAIELGVHQGEFAAHFLTGCEMERYLAVDLYLPYCDMPRPREIDQQIAHARLLRFGDRVVWEPRDSLHVIQELPPASISFGYIDEEHTYWAVTLQMRSLWEKMVPGGIMAGHDFGAGFPHVNRAVREFSDRENITIWLTQDDHQPWSWYAFKPEAQCAS